MALISRLGGGLVVPLLLLPLTGCVSTYCNPGIRTRAYLYDAYHAWENSKNAEALTAVKRALAFSQKEDVPETILVEVYDDAGLYFYLGGLYGDSVRNQSIAVLLARKFEVSPQMTRAYEDRLGRALEAADSGDRRDNHNQDTERLLAIPGVLNNPHIRKYYGLR